MANGLQYTLDKAISVKGGGASNAATASVTAASFGVDYNIEADTPMAIAGYDQKSVGAVAKASFTGGSKETVKVVQQSDIDAAGENLKKKATDDQAKIKSDLTAQMGGGVTALADSFAVSYGNLNSKPAVDETLRDGNATVTMEITYTLIGVADSDLKTLLTKEIESLAVAGQKIYSSGLDKIQFKNFAVDGQNYSVVVKTAAQIGPEIDEQQIKDRAVGKRSGQIAADLETISGVNNVEVKFSPFWVGAAPSADRLKVEFTVEE